MHHQILSRRHETKSKGEPSFLNINNPGNWLEYTFCPEFAKKDIGGNYTCHPLPTGVLPVPIKDGKQEAAGWEFHYKGWKYEDPIGNTSFQSGAWPENLFPKSHHQRCLDANC